ncbi:MAG: EAL domain-containing protein [Burkholderiaceae bacterium]
MTAVPSGQWNQSSGTNLPEGASVAASATSSMSQKARPSMRVLLRAINASGIPGLYLDGQLRIGLYTAGIREFLHLIDSDLGQDLRDFHIRAPDVSVFEDLALAQTSRHPQERQITQPNGRCFLRRINPDFDQDGRVSGYLLTWVPINRLAGRLQNLTDREDHWRELAGSLPQLIFTTDEQGEVNFLSAQWAQLGQVSGRANTAKLLAFVHPDERGGFLCGWRQAFESGDGFETDCRLINADHGYRWYRIKAQHTADAADQPAGWIGSFTDVHSLKVSEQTVSSRRERIEALYDSAPVSLLVVDWRQLPVQLRRLEQQGVKDLATHLARHPAAARQLRSAVELTDCNEWAVAMFGFQSKQQVIENLVSPQQGSALDDVLSCAIASYAAGDSSYRTEIALSKLGGSSVHCLLTFRFPMQPSDQGLALVSLIDIDERKQVEDKLKASELRQRTLIEAITDSGLDLRVVDNNGEVRYTNRRIIGKNGTAEPVMPASDVIDIGDSDDLRRVALEGRAVRGRVDSLDGRSYDVVAVPYRDVDGSVCRLELMRDDSAMRLAAEQQRIAATTFESQDAMIVMDSRGHILRANRAFTQLFGFEPDAIVGSDLDFLYANVHDETWQQEMRQALRLTGHWSGEVSCVRQSGDEFPCWHRITSVSDDRGQVTHFVGAYADISDRKESEERIRKLAFFDPLTNLPNRRLLLDRLGHRLAASKRHESYGALLFLDLDHFKRLNDNFGHDVGDKLLVEVAQRLRRCSRGVDTIARFGGDEFLVIVDDLSQDSRQAAAQAESVADKIRTELGRPYDFIGSEHEFGVSIGICMFFGDETSVDTLLKQADMALYQAKEAGRNSIRFYNPVLQAQIDARAELDFLLRHAIGRGELLLFYQPQLSRGGHLMGAEALLRWRHPERGLVLPGTFIAHAEDTGLILPIGRWVLETACQQLASWARFESTRHLKLSVNISPRQFRQENFVEQIRMILAETRADPNLLNLELTESVLIDNIEDAIKRMRALKDMGVGFSIDDFGTGYSSLSYLKRLPVDQLKIDKSFVRDIANDPDDAAIVKAIIGMGRSLDLMVFAEGVETGAQYDFLERNGCDAFQGFLFGRPVAGTNELLSTVALA